MALQEKLQINAVAKQPPSRQTWREVLSLLAVLFKLRVVFLLLVAATGGAFLAAGGWPGLSGLLLVWVTGGLSAAGASALNEYWERDIDGIMERTRKRPLVTGAITKPAWVPIMGLLMIFIPSFAVYSFNPALTFFLLLGAFIYVVIYTIWLKPRTLLNVVIGGAAGSAAVLSGAAALGAWDAPGALLLAGLLFFWSPSHFWSLALLYRKEYAAASFPMLPAKVSPKQAAWWVASHTIPAGVFGLLLATLPELGWVFLIPALWATGSLLWNNIKLIQEPSPSNARKMFMASNIYLLILLIAICVGSIIPF